jgi:hypothetical protein
MLMLDWLQNVRENLRGRLEWTSRRPRARRNLVWHSLVLNISAFVERLESRRLLSAITVDSSTDTEQAGRTTLRDAIAQANADVSGDTITFASGLAGSAITLTQGALLVTSSVTITGLGANQLAIDANNLSRIFEIRSGTSGNAVTITGLTLRHGDSALPGLNGGAVYNAENLTLANDVIAGNSGSGIFNDAQGILTLKGDTISGNSAPYEGGGIYSNGPVTSTNDMFSGNSAPVGGGGAIFSNDMFTSTNDTIAGNSSGGAAGGIAVNGTFIATNDIISGNSGGGIANGGTFVSTNNLISGNVNLNGSEYSVDGGGIFSDGTFISTNDTIADNYTNGVGGGINNDGTLTLVNDTISGNQAEQDGGGISGEYGTIAVINTIVVGNIGHHPAFNNVDAYLAENMDNILGGSLASILQTNSSGQPLLANNGGPTPTIALATGSPAINAGIVLTNVTALGDAGTTLTVANTTFLAAGDFLRIGTEIVEVTSVANSSTITVQRAKAGTTQLNLNNLPVTLAYDQRGFARVTNDLGATAAIYPPAAGALTPPTAVEGAAFGPVTVFHFTDANPIGIASDYLATVVTGDGTTLTSSANPGNVVVVSDIGGGFDIQLSYSYSEELTNQTFSVSVSDAQGNTTGLSTNSFSVADAALADMTDSTTISGAEGNANKNVTLMTFNDGNRIASVADFSVSTVNWGGTLSGSTPTLTVVADPAYSGAGSEWKVVADAVVYLEPGVYPVSLVVKDVGGSQVSSANTRFSIADAVLIDSTPVQTLSAVAGKSTGSLALATFTDANPLATLPDFAPNVNWGGALIGIPTISVQLVSRSPTVSTWVVVGTARYSLSGTYSVSVVVNDVDGSSVSTSNTKISVTSGPLNDTTPVNVTTHTGTEGNTTASQTIMTFTDSNPAATLTDFQTPIVNWGGAIVGTFAAAIQFVSKTAAISNWKIVGSAAYADAGKYNLTVTVFDTHGAAVQSNKTNFTISDAPLTDTTVASIQNAVEGNSTGSIVLSTFTDADPIATLSDYKLTVAWNGTLIGSPSSAIQLVSSSSAGSTWQVVGSAVYAEKGTYTPTIKVADVDGTALTSAKTKFTVADAPLTDTAPLATLNSVEGNSTGTVTLATFVDGDPTAPLSDFKATVNWIGKVIGTPSVSMSLVSTSTATSTWKVTGNAVYAEPGTYAPAVTITDKDGSSLITSNTSISVAEAPLTDTTVMTTLKATEGKTTGTITLGTFTDGNPQAPVTDFTPVVNWNGALIGTPTLTVALVSRIATVSNWKVTGSAVYADAGLYNFGVTVNDADGASVSTSKTSVNVADAPLTDTTTTTTLNVTRGMGFSNVVLAQFTDANPFAQASDFANISVNWGGPVSGASFSLVFVSTSSAGSIWQVVGSATYTADGTLSVTVTVPDIDGLILVSKRTKFQVTG